MKPVIVFGDLEYYVELQIKLDSRIDNNGLTYVRNICLDDQLGRHPPLIQMWWFFTNYRYTIVKIQVTGSLLFLSLYQCFNYSIFCCLLHSRRFFSACWRAFWQLTYYLMFPDLLSTSQSTRNRGKYITRDHLAFARWLLGPKHGLRCPLSARLALVEIVHRLYTQMLKMLWTLPAAEQSKWLRLL